MIVKIKVKNLDKTAFYNVKKIKLYKNDNTINIFDYSLTKINHYKYSIDIIEKLTIKEK